MHQIYNGGVRAVAFTNTNTNTNTNTLCTRYTMVVGAGASTVSLHFPAKLQLIAIIGWSHFKIRI